MPLDVIKVRKLMGERSQKQVAMEAGMMQPALARLLRGRLDPKLSTVEKLARVLGVGVADITK